MPGNQAVITGLGVVSSIGIGIHQYFRALIDCTSGIRSLAERTDEEAMPGCVREPGGLWIGGPVIDFDAKQYVRPRKSLKVMCREIQTAFAASQLAIEHAGLQEWLPAELEGKVSPTDIATVFGSEMYYGPPPDLAAPVRQCYDENGDFNGAKFGAAAKREVMPLWMLKYLPNMPACHVGISVNARGPNNSIVQGDVSGPAALIEAVSYIKRGAAKIVFTGASGTRINATRMNYRNDYPFAGVADPIANSSRPHDPTSIGIVGGEAAAVAILESEDQANARDAPVLAKVASCVSRFVGSAAMRQGPRSATNQWHPAGPRRGSSAAIQLAINDALQQANLTPSDIGLIISHAMGDPVMDAAEREALPKEFARTPMVAPIASLGHAGAASGAMELVTGVMALAGRQIPPTLNAGQSSGVRLLTEAAALERPTVLCITHTSEGNATAIVLRE